MALFGFLGISQACSVKFSASYLQRFFLIKCNSVHLIWDFLGKKPGVSALFLSIEKILFKKQLS